MLTKTATMKPTVTLDEKIGVHVVQQQANGHKVDTGVVVNINGAKTDKQGDLISAYYDVQFKFHNVNLTTHIVPSSEDIKEEIVISDQEEDISTPKARVIYDYASGYVVTKFKDSEDETCYVSEFNVLGRNDGLRSNLESGGNETSVYTNSTEEMYETTGETVNKTLLSPRAAEMCAGSQILTVVISEDDSSDRVKRGCYTRCGTVCRLVYGPHRVKSSCSGRWWRKRCTYRIAYGWYRACSYRCVYSCSFG